MPEDVTVPSVLQGQAAEIWKSAFLAAYNGTCKDKKEGQKDGCSAAVAWSAVKEKFTKNESTGEWVERADIEAPTNEGMDQYPSPINSSDSVAPIPAGLPEEARNLFDMAWQDAINTTCSQAAEPRKCATQEAWGKVYESYYKSDNGQWVKRNMLEKMIAKHARPEPKQIEVEPQVEVETETPKVEAKTFTTPEAFQARRFFSRKERDQLAKSGKALPWGGFPITDCTDVKNAVRAIGRAKDRSRTIAHIKKHAKSLGCTHLVPKKWREGSEAKEKSVAATEDSKFYESEETLVHRAKVAGLEPSVLLKRRSARAKAHADDIALLEAGYADHPARRPEDIPSEVWRTMEPHLRTVGAIVWRRHVERKYEEAVEDALLKGWKGEKNPSRPEEWIFKSWVDTPDGWQLVRTILVRRADSDEWYMKEISRGASKSLAIRVAPHEARR